jgi:diguanylate cyclase (GGDEF)-like protein
LTGLNNRRHFDEVLAQEWARAVRQRSMLSVVLIDVDHFKHYNDHYGHMAGDDCLRRIATTIRSQVKRPADLAARYGGEEFACILPETGHDGALQFARCMGDAIRAMGMPHATAAHSDVVTISLGVCSGHGVAGYSQESMLERADAQLYAAKAQGRDRVNGICIDPS